MRRLLFWKFLLALWLAQVITTAGVGMLIAYSHTGPRPPHLASPSGPRPGPPPGWRGEPADGHPPMPPKGPPPPQGVMLPLGPILVGSVVSLCFAALAAWYFAAPIRRLRMAFESIAAGSLATRVGDAMHGRRDELAELGRDFDRMASRLQSVIEAQRRLLHDVSHELRSPLARLQAAAGLLHQQPARHDELTARIERDIERMDDLVGELLTLARLDDGTTRRRDEPVNLHELIDDIARDARFDAGSKSCRVTVAPDGDAMVTGERDLICRAIENVVRNAVRHAPDCGTVAITAGTAGNVCNVVVADDGPGVPEAALSSIFEPFFRGEHRDANGYGLGLAITRRVVLAHGGEVAARNRPEGGLEVTLSFPRG